MLYSQKEENLNFNQWLLIHRRRFGWKYGLWGLDRLDNTMRCWNIFLNKAKLLHRIRDGYIFDTWYIQILQTCPSLILLVLWILKYQKIDFYQYKTTLKTWKLISICYCLPLNKNVLYTHHRETSRDALRILLAPKWVGAKWPNSGWICSL